MNTYLADISSFEALQSRDGSATTFNGFFSRSPQTKNGGGLVASGLVSDRDMPLYVNSIVHMAKLMQQKYAMMSRGRGNGSIAREFQRCVEVLKNDIIGLEKRVKTINVPW